MYDKYRTISSTYWCEKTDTVTLIPMAGANCVAASVDRTLEAVQQSAVCGGTKR